MSLPPARMRRPTLLIVGCGDVGLRVLRLVQPRWRVLALTSSPERCELLRAQGAVPLLGNLDEPATLGRLGGLADAVLHLAPPPGHGHQDLRTANLLRALARGGRSQTLVYASTSGLRRLRRGALRRDTRGQSRHRPRAASRRRRSPGALVWP